VALFEDHKQEGENNNVWLYGGFTPWDVFSPNNGDFLEMCCENEAPP